MIATATTTTYVGFATLIILLFFYVLRKIDDSRLSLSEPPLLKPRVPLVGHIIGLLSHEASYFSTLCMRAKSQAIAISMLNKKTYVLFSPYLMQQAMRSRSLDFIPVALEFNKKAANISEHGMALSVAEGPGTYTTDTMAALKVGLMGEPLYHTNNALLAYIGSRLNAIGTTDSPELHVPSFWLWMRELVAMATTEAIYGRANPFRTNSASLDALWGFDDAIQSMLIMPSLLARAGARYRDRVARTLRPYFEARLDRNDDVSKFVSLQTESSVKHSWVGDDLYRSGVMNLWASTTNSIPALFWVFTDVWLSDDLTEKVRAEILPFVVFSKIGEKRKATLNIRQIEKKCPLLLSCYRETLRSKGHMVARRIVTVDTQLTDEDGTTYLLKAGNSVMWSAIVAHQLPDIWGSDSHDYNPERLLKQADKDTERKRRAAYMPFGGGIHLCPGRHLAFDEILGLTSALLLGYEIEGLSASRVKVGKRRLVSGIPKPAKDGDGGPVILRRRKGWEDVLWDFECRP